MPWPWHRLISHVLVLLESRRFAPFRWARWCRFASARASHKGEWEAMERETGSNPRHPDWKAHARIRIPFRPVASLERGTSASARSLAATGTGELPLLFRVQARRPGRTGPTSRPPQCNGARPPWRYRDDRELRAGSRRDRQDAGRARWRQRRAPGGAFADRRHSRAGWLLRDHGRLPANHDHSASDRRSARSAVAPAPGQPGVDSHTQRGAPPELRRDRHP